MGLNLFRKTLLITVGVATVVSGAFAADFHHVHLTATDTAQAAKWYETHFGGHAVKFGPYDICAFGKTLLVFRQAAAGFPGSEGSSIDHIGFSVPDTAAKIKELAAAGVKVVAEPKAIKNLHYAFVEDPWGTKIEVLDDPDIQGFHHVHLHSPNAAKTVQWYADNFGGEPTRYLGIIPAIRYGDMWLLVQNVKKAKAPTAGRSIDHIGWSFPDLKKTVADMKAKGVKIIKDVTETPVVTYAFVEGPDGVKIELVQQS